MRDERDERDERREGLREGGLALLEGCASPRTPVDAVSKLIQLIRVAKIRVKIFEGIANDTSFHTDKNRYYT